MAGDDEAGEWDYLIALKKNNSTAHQLVHRGQLL